MKNFCINLQNDYTNYIINKKNIKNINEKLNNGYERLNRVLSKYTNSCDKIKYNKSNFNTNYIHSVWVGIKEKHKDYFNDNESKDFFLSNIKILNHCNYVIRYTVWTNDIYLLPISNFFLKKLKLNIIDMSYITDKKSRINLEYLMSSSSKFAYTLLSNTFLSMSSDILRYSALQKKGGLYLDIDYILHQNPDFIINKTDFSGGLFRISHPYLLASSFVSSKINHIASSKILDNINDNINILAKNDYFHLILENGILNKKIVNIQSFEDSSHEILYNCNIAFAVDFIAGPGIFSKSLYDKLNVNGGTDVSLGYEILHHFSDYSSNKILSLSLPLNLDYTLSFNNIGHDIDLTGWYKIYFENPVTYEYNIKNNLQETVINDIEMTSLI